VDTCTCTYLIAYIHRSLLIYFLTLFAQVAKYIPFGQTQTTPLNDHALDSETQRTESQSDEESRVGNTLDVSTSPTVDFHIAGDIVHVREFSFPRFHFIDIIVSQLIPTTLTDARQVAFINVSGKAFNSNKTIGSFEINASQYTSHYKTNKTLSVFPVRALFNTAKYKLKKPAPSDNSYVSVEGFLAEIETDSNQRPLRFLVSVDNINFLGKAPASSSLTGSIGKQAGSSSRS
jgi:hypothetical protein